MNWLWYSIHTGSSLPTVQLLGFWLVILVATNVALRRWLAAEMRISLQRSGNLAPFQPLHPQICFKFQTCRLQSKPMLPVYLISLSPIRFYPTFSFTYAVMLLNTCKQTLMCKICIKRRPMKILDRTGSPKSLDTLAGGGKPAGSWWKDDSPRTSWRKWWYGGWWVTQCLKTDRIKITL